MSNVLIIATTSYAGMGPYVSGIVNNFNVDDPVYYDFCNAEDEFYRKNIKHELIGKSRFFLRADSNWNKLKDLLHPRPSKKSLQQLKDYCTEKDIRIVHWINGPGNRYINQYLKENGIKVLSTVHDLHPHEAKKAVHKMLRFHVNAHRNQLAIKEAEYMVTNSRTQFDELKELYPDKGIYFHEFPSLVNPALAEGCAIPQEMEGITSPYILFFGRIEEYKGISLLYEAFTECTSLSSRYKLVIAGSGTLSFRRKKDEKNVIVINRYIKDEEVKFLYEHAACVAYPYISATQSGVLSLAYYFGTPVLASDVDFFKGIISSSGAGRLFRKCDVDDLKKQLLYIVGHDNTGLIAAEKKYYKDYYDGDAIRKELLHIYEQIRES